MILYLIRHGKTEANERHLYCGSSDLSLSDLGRAELKQKHYEIDGVRFLSSGMHRTEETLAILFGNVSHGIEPRFREVDFGAFELKSYEELKDDPDYQAWITGDNERNVPPNGESGEQMRRRVMEALGEICEDTVIVTHGGVIACIMARLFPEDGKNRYQWQPKCGGGYRIDMDAHIYELM